MNTSPLLRIALPLLSFGIAFTSTAGLSLSAADNKADKKAPATPEKERR